MYDGKPITTAAQVYLLLKAISQNSGFRAQFHLKTIVVPRIYMPRKARPPPINFAHGVRRKGDRARKILPRDGARRWAIEAVAQGPTVLI
jgi:hypothetical protein